MTSTKKTTPLTSEEQQKIVNTFQSLREEQTQLVQKMQDLEMDLKEHDLVLSTLSNIIDRQRRCYRMIGGVLIEHTVGEVVPALQSNREQISNVIESFKEKIEVKGKEIADYKQKNDIHYAHEPAKSTSTKKDAQETGVLVEKENV